MSVCGSTLGAKGRVSGSRIQHRDSCRAALPKPASWRYRQTAGGRQSCAHLCGEWDGKSTEIVHDIAAKQRHDIIRAGGRRVVWWS